MCNLFARFARQILVKVLSKDPLLRAKFSISNEVELYQEVISAKYLMLENEYPVADGLKLHLKQSGDCVIQEMFIIAGPMNIA